MNVIVANNQQNELANLDIDIIKSVTGSYNASEIVEMFKSFFYSKMILDVTAIKDYNQLEAYEVLAKGLDPNKIVFLLPEGSKLCTPNFLSKLISLGVYSFTTNLKGVKYLLKKPNTLKDVEHIVKMANKNNNAEVDNSKNIASVNDINKVNNTSNSVPSTSKVSSPPTKVSNKGTKIIGFKGVTEHAGTTTLIYMLRKELANTYGNNNVIAIEIDKNDFQLFNDKNMYSIKAAELNSILQRYSGVNIILVDLDSSKDDSFCNDIVYLLEPSTIKLNKLIRKNKLIFSRLTNKKVVLNNSLLLSSDVSDFEGEAGIKVFYNLPPLDERKKNDILTDFLIRLGLLGGSSVNNSNSNKIFGLFRR